MYRYLCEFQELRLEKGEKPENFYGMKTFTKI